MPTLNISRHVDLFNPYHFNTPITIIGAGALGSWLTLALAKLSLVNINIWDYDNIEEHNIANQAFSLSDVGNNKATTIANQIYNTTGINISPFERKFTNQRLSGVVFLMVDSMEQRKKIWESSIKLNPSVNLLIEARMGLDVGRVYNVEPTNLTHIKKYEDTYYDDDVTEISACGNSKTVISTALGIVSWCVRQLINWHNKIELDNEILIDFVYNNIITAKW